MFELSPKRIFPPFLVSPFFHKKNGTVQRNLAGPMMGIKSSWRMLVMPGELQKEICYDLVIGLFAWTGTNRRWRCAMLFVGFLFDSALHLFVVFAKSCNYLHLPRGLVNISIDATPATAQERARSFLLVTLWCAAWRFVIMSSRGDLGTTMRDSFTIKPSSIAS